MLKCCVRSPGLLSLAGALLALPWAGLVLAGVAGGVLLLDALVGGVCVATCWMTRLCKPTSMVMSWSVSRRTPSAPRKGGTAEGGGGAAGIGGWVVGGGRYKYSAPTAVVALVMASVGVAWVIGSLGW